MHGSTPVQVLRVALWSVLIIGLGIGTAPAQLLNEIMRAAVCGMPSDVFACGAGNTPCGLTYRVYPSVDPGEINGPANPTDGIPRIRILAGCYVTDALTTANFPNGNSAGPGNEWYVAWDGITDSGTDQHAGWYGAQSQVVFVGEIGNSLSFNCLPVLAQEACFPALDERTAFNDTVRADGSPLLHLGGISPIPCPTLAANGLTSLTYSWEQPTNNTSTDGAASAVTSAELFLFPNPASPLTDAELAASAVRVRSLSPSQTTVILPRAELDATSGLVGATIFSAALKVGYAGGLESLFFSCNSAVSGVQAADEPGDAPASVDVGQVYAEIQAGSNILVVTLDMVDNTVIEETKRYRLRFSTPAGGDARAEIKVKKARPGRLRVRQKADFDFSGIENSSFDNVSGRVVFRMDADVLAAHLGSSTASVTAEVQFEESPGTVVTDVVLFNVSF